MHRSSALGTKAAGRSESGTAGARQQPVRTATPGGALESVDAMAAIFRPVRAGNTFEETVERVLTAVKLGLVDDQERLPTERELAARLEVSRTTLREAIRSLREAGYVESRRGRNGGTFVTYRPRESHATASLDGIHGAQLNDTLIFRETLEIGAASIAARSVRSERELGHLQQCLEMAASADLDGYRRADSRLHLSLAQLTGSPSLVAATADVRMRLNSLLDSIPLLERNIRHSNDQHSEIVKAVTARDPERARRAMADHLEGTASLLRGFLA